MKREKAIRPSTGLPVVVSKNSNLGAVRHNRKGDAQTREAIDIVTAALYQSKDKLKAIYLFSLKSSLPRLIDLVAELRSSYKASPPSAVSDLGHWLDGVKCELAARGGRATKVADQPSLLFDLTLEMRKKIHAVLERRSPKFGVDTALRSAFARWIITTWGGVDRNEVESCPDLVKKAESWNPPENLDEYSRVARWSKYLAFRHPNAAAILDARVVYSLNWHLRKARVAKLFKTLPSENSMMGVLDHSGLVASRRMSWRAFERAVKDDIDQRERGLRINSKIRSIIEGPDYVVEDEKAYGYYMKILAGVSKKLFNDDWGITKTEMMLFGSATTSVATEVCAALRNR